MEQQFEGHVVKNLEDLLAIESNETSAQIDSLTDEMQQYRETEQQSRAFLEKHFDMQAKEINELVNLLKGDQDRIAEIEQLV